MRRNASYLKLADSNAMSLCLKLVFTLLKILQRVLQNMLSFLIPCQIESLSFRMKKSIKRKFQIEISKTKLNGLLNIS